MSGSPRADNTLWSSCIDVVLISSGASVEGHNHRYLTRIARRLQEKGNSVRVVVPTDARPVPGVPTIHVDARLDAVNSARFLQYGHLLGPIVRGLTRIRAGGAFLRKALDRVVLPSASSGRSTIVHLLDYEYLSASAALRRIAKTPGLSSVVTIHPSDFQGAGWRFEGIYKRAIYWPFRMALKSVGAVVCHGPWIRERLVEQLALEPDRVYALYYPSDSLDARIPQVTARKRLGLEAENTVVLWFGIIRRNKRFDLAAATIAKLPENVQFLVAGRPAELSESEVKSIIHDNGIASRTTLCLNYIAEEDIPVFFSAADVLIATHDASFTSASGPISDARTYRLPVVATKAGQLAEYINRFGVGRVPEVNNPDGFADAISRVLMQSGVIVNAIEDVAFDLSWEKFADAHHDIYLGLA